MPHPARTHRTKSLELPHIGLPRLHAQRVHPVLKLIANGSGRPPRGVDRNLRLHRGGGGHPHRGHGTGKTHGLGGRPQVFRRTGRGCGPCWRILQDTGHKAAVARRGAGTAHTLRALWPVCRHKHARSPSHRPTSTMPGRGARRPQQHGHRMQPRMARAVPTSHSTRNRLGHTAPPMPRPTMGPYQTCAPGMGFEGVFFRSSSAGHGKVGRGRHRRGSPGCKRTGCHPPGYRSPGGGGPGWRGSLGREPLAAPIRAMPPPCHGHRPYQQGGRPRMPVCGSRWGRPTRTPAPLWRTLRQSRRRATRTPPHWRG